MSYEDSTETCALISGFLVAVTQTTLLPTPSWVTASETSFERHFYVDISWDTVCSTSGWYHLVLNTVSKDCGFRSYVTVHSSTFKTFPTHHFFAQSIVYYITNMAMLSLSHVHAIFFGDFLKVLLNWWKYPKYTFILISWPHNWTHDNS